jgi:hypothetical protein
MSSPQMIRTFGLSLTGWPFAVEAATRVGPGQLTLACTGRPSGILDSVSAATTGFRLASTVSFVSRHPLFDCLMRSAHEVLLPLLHRRRRPGVRALPLVKGRVLRAEIRAAGPPPDPDRVAEGIARLAVAPLPLLTPSRRENETAGNDPD